MDPFDCANKFDVNNVVDSNDEIDIGKLLGATQMFCSTTSTSVWNIFILFGIICIILCSLLSIISSLYFTLRQRPVKKKEEFRNYPGYPSNRKQFV